MTNQAYPQSVPFVFKIRQITLLVLNRKKWTRRTTSRLPHNFRANALSAITIFDGHQIYCLHRMHDHTWIPTKIYNYYYFLNIQRLLPASLSTWLCGNIASLNLSWNLSKIVRPEVSLEVRTTHRKTASRKETNKRDITISTVLG